MRTSGLLQGGDGLFSGRSEFWGSSVLIIKYQSKHYISRSRWIKITTKTIGRHTKEREERRGQGWRTERKKKEKEKGWRRERRTNRMPGMPSEGLGPQVISIPSLFSVELYIFCISFSGLTKFRASSVSPQCLLAARLAEISWTCKVVLKGNLDNWKVWQEPQVWS